MVIGFAIAAVAAVVDWIAVARQRVITESIAKPLVMVGLLVQVFMVGDGRLAVLLAAAVGASLLGDVLLLPRVDSFIGGLGAFLVGHVLYIAAFLQVGLSPLAFAVGCGAMLVAAGTVGRRIVGATSGPLTGAVAAYIAVLGLMVAVAVATTTVTLAVGAIVFAVSDTVLGWNRFVRPLPHGRLATHVPYHVGQALIVLGAVGT